MSLLIYQRRVVREVERYLAEVSQQVPNLDMLEEDAENGRFLTATSIGNLVRLCRPAVILDEGHKATSELARKTIEGFNPSVIVELSATPQQGANILTRVNGQELLDEEMIKLPLNIATSGQKAWPDVLTQARDKRTVLAEIAHQFATSAGPDRLIRPIVLVQVERTGKDQEDTQYIHSRQVKAYLIERLGVSEQAIAIKSARLRRTGGHRRTPAPPRSGHREQGAAPGREPRYDLQAKRRQFIQ